MFANKQGIVKYTRSKIFSKKYGDLVVAFHTPPLEKAKKPGEIPLPIHSPIPFIVQNFGHAERVGFKFKDLPEWPSQTFKSRDKQQGLSQHALFHYTCKDLGVLQCFTICHPSPYPPSSTSWAPVE